MYHFFILIFGPCQHIYWFISSIFTWSSLKVPPFYILLIPFMLLKLWNSSTSMVTTESPHVASQFSRECYSSTPREVTKVWNICTKVKLRIFRQCLFCRTGHVQCTGTMQQKMTIQHSARKDFKIWWRVGFNKSKKIYLPTIVRHCDLSNCK